MFSISPATTTASTIAEPSTAKASLITGFADAFFGGGRTRLIVEQVPVVCLK